MLGVDATDEQKIMLQVKFQFIYITCWPGGRQHSNLTNKMKDLKLMLHYTFHEFPTFDKLLWLRWYTYENEAWKWYYK